MTPSLALSDGLTTREGDAPACRRGLRLLRSAGIRFAVIYALLLAVSAAALAMFLWWATAGLLDRQTEAAIQADAQSLAERFAAGRLPALVMTIEDRLTQDVEDDSVYLLVDPAGRRIAGNLSHWPQEVTQSAAWYELPIERAGVRSLALVQRYELPGGLHLLIGRDAHLRAQLRALLADALLWALVVVGAMASIGALVVRTLFRRTLANVSATAAAISAGDFSQRVRLSGRGDEFDQLAETINDMLDRLGRLMEGVREVSNAIAHDLRTPITRARARLEDAAEHAGSRPSCGRRSSGRQQIWMISSPCSRRFCASRRSRPARAVPHSRGSISRRCSPTWPNCTARSPRRRGPCCRSMCRPTCRCMATVI